MKIKLLVMDVDGTLTDGRIYTGPDGEVMKSFDVKDGYGIVLFKKTGGIPVIITGRKSKIVEQRCEELGITEIHQGIEDKLFCLKSILKRYGLKQEQAAYIGDDINDLECLNYVGLSACPKNAHKEVKQKVCYRCIKNGGHGAVREFIDLIISKD